MGDDVAATVFSREDRQRYRAKVKRCLDVFARMLSESRFDAARGSIGLEIELNLTDEGGDPALVNAKVLEVIADADFQTELAQFNVEINVAPRTLSGTVLSELERDVRTSLNNAEEKARSVGAHMVMVGILPTVTDRHLNAESFSANPRYELLNEQIFAARGEDLDIRIAGVERLATFADTITPEAACTSVQLHLQVDPGAFGLHWNAAQAIAGMQLALAGNSPFFFGKELWRETRIPLFEQATDTRSEELRAQGVRPRVWFGERWITSIFDLFEENVRYFPALLPVCEEEDPVEVLAARRHPAPAGAAAAQRHDLPLEPADLRRRARPPAPARGEPRAARRPDGRRHPRQRRLLLRADPHAGRRRTARSGRRCRSRPPRRTSTPARATGSRRTSSGRASARCRSPSSCCGGCCRWPTRAWSAGAWTAADRDRLLGVIEQRCLKGANGASWQAATFHRLYEDDKLDRTDALREMTVRYRDLMHSNEPVHDWPVA